MSNHHYVVAAAVLVAALLMVGCAANNSNGREDQAQPAASGTVTSSSAPTPSPSESPRWGHYGEPASTPGPGAFSGWSREEQEHAQEFALVSMQVFAMKTDQATWHEYMDPRVTDEYREQLKTITRSTGIFVLCSGWCTANLERTRLRRLFVLKRLMVYGWFTWCALGPGRNLRLH